MSDQEHTQLAQKLAVLTTSAEHYEMMVEDVLAQVFQVPEYAEAFNTDVKRRKADSVVRALLSLDVLRAQQAADYAGAFTLQELQELYAFSSGPVGQKLSGLRLVFASNQSERIGQVLVTLPAALAKQVR